MLGGGKGCRRRTNRFVIHNSSEDSGLVSDLLTVRESSILHETEDKVLVAGAMARMEDAREEPMETAQGSFYSIEIGEVQGASRLEDTKGLPK